MRHDVRSDFEVFLVEDVILTLGNLRGSLGWLTSGASADPAALRVGLDRIDRQIALLEDRARSLKTSIAAGGSEAVAAPATAAPNSPPPFPHSGPPDDDANIFAKDADAPPDVRPRAVAFRSYRTARG